MMRAGGEAEGVVTSLIPESQAAPAICSTPLLWPSRPGYLEAAGQTGTKSSDVASRYIGSTPGREAANCDGCPRILPNHWHLLLRPESAEALPAFMRRLTLTHSRRWQTCYARPGQGTLYQGRYRSARVEGDAQLLTVLRYIERNPVRAGLVASAFDWPWSSLLQRLRGRPGRLAALPVALPDGWLAHVDAPQTAGEVAAVRRAVSGGRPGRPRRTAVGEVVTGR